MLQNAWVDGTTDSRNVAVQEFIINVENVADTPPIFVSAPPVTRLPESSKIGDFVCNIVAVDGDKGLGRPIRYFLDTRFRLRDLLHLHSRSPVLDTVTMLPTSNWTPWLGDWQWSGTSRIWRQTWVPECRFCWGSLHRRWRMESQCTSAKTDWWTKYHP